MKKITLSLVMITLAISLLAQSPQSFKYQTVVRDNTGEILTNQAVSFRNSIRKDSIDGEWVYIETCVDTTNQFGMVTLEIGNGTGVAGVFEDIDWGDGLYFLRIRMDATGGTNYLTMGTTQLMSVPYALYAESSGDAGATKIDDLTDAITVGNNVYIGRDAGINDDSTNNQNVAVGREALMSNTSGNINTAIGYFSLSSNTEGYQNTATGYNSLFSNTTGIKNTAYGFAADLNNVAGSNNTIIGYQAGRGTNLHSKTGNVFLGYQAGYNDTTDNKLYIENSPSSTPLIYGDFENDILAVNGNLGIGTSTPNANLDIIGDIGIDPSPSADYLADGITSMATVSLNDQGCGSALYMAPDGNYETASASDENKLPCVALAVEEGTGNKKVLHYGYYRNDNWNWTIGGIIYLDASIGQLTQTIPSGDNDIIQVLGFATYTNRIMFNPSYVTSRNYMVNHAPVANFYTSSNSIYINNSMSYFASDSYDPDFWDSIISYEWDFDGDGIYDESTTESTISHYHGYPGIFTIKLRVTDNIGLTDEFTQSVEILDCDVVCNATDCSSYYFNIENCICEYYEIPGACNDDDPGTIDLCDLESGCFYIPNNNPVASFIVSPVPGIAGDPVNFDAGSSYDPDDEYGDYITTYEWDWNGDGIFDDSFQYPQTFHQYFLTGYYTVILRVTDSNGLTDLESFNLQVL